MKAFLGSKVFGRSLFVVVAIVVVVTGGYYLLQYQKNQQLKDNPTRAAQEEAKTLAQKVGKLIVLPQDELPTIATVSDISKLQGQSFFKNAKNGFKVLIYTRAKKAILYDPVNNRVVEVTVLNLTQSTSTPVAMAPVKVALYNGTTVVGLTTTVAQKLSEKDKTISVVVRTNASKFDYTKTLVIDLTNKQSARAAQIANLLDGEVASLPDGEEKPEGADILVILGAQ